LHDAEQQHRQREQSRAWNALEDEANADQQHLDERDAHHALRDGANGRDAQFGDLRAVVGTGDA
jgi:hypothetical protein